MKTLVGGEITGYTEMLNEARQIATKRMVDEAKEMNADAVIGVKYGSSQVMSAGIKILTSKDAKKLYTNCTAAVLRAKACVMKTASAIQENAEDIYAEAQQINEDRAAAEEVVEDTADEAAEETEETTDFKEETEETEEGSEE